MINVNVLPVSLYFNIYGLVYEVNQPAEKELNAEILSSKGSNPAIHADWICDYTGYVYKCRDPDHAEIKKFLLSERESFKKFNSVKDLQEFLAPIHPIVNAHREWVNKRYK